MTDVPNMEVLLKDAPTNWGKWGPDDEVGALNYLTAEEVLRGVRHITSGKVFTLQRLIGDPKGDPVWPGRTPGRAHQILDESSWDGDGAARSRAACTTPTTRSTPSSRARRSTTPSGTSGTAARSGTATTPAPPSAAWTRPASSRSPSAAWSAAAVLLDMARFRGKDNLDKAETFTHEDLLACAKAQGVEIEKRDILMIRTNFLKLFFEQGDAFYEGFCEPGLVYSPELVQWFQDMEIPNLVTDTIANEVTTDPNNGVALALHSALMRNLGVTLTEISTWRSSRPTAPRTASTPSSTSPRRSRSPRPAARRSTPSSIK